MSLVINHNSTADRIANQLSSHYAQLEKSTQRLSSGLRVNSAADDAAGLAIRELMRADIAALHQGIRNTNDAISMLQTADGALGIIDEKLIRMKELAEQAATGTYDSTQRAMIDSEFQMMASEIDRIARATDFNGIKLLDGEFEVTNTGTVVDPSGTTYTHTEGVSNVRNNLPATFTAQASALDPTVSLGDASQLVGTTTITVKNANTSTIGNTGVTVTASVSDASTTFPSSLRIKWESARTYLDPNTYTQKQGTWVIDDTDYEYEMMYNTQPNHYTSSPNKLMISLGSGHSVTVNIGCSSTDGIDGISTSINLIDDSLDPEYEYTISGAAGSSSGSITLSKGSSSLTFTFDLGHGNSLTQTFSLSSGTANAYTLSGFTDKLTVTAHDPDDPTPLEPIPDDVVKIHFGPGNDKAEDYYYIDKSNATLKGLGLEGVSIETQESAQKALNIIDEAIVKKDQIRAYYGAMQNRLENTMTTLQVQSENLQSAESRISDADVALEMTNFIRNQILTQSAVAMLAQANSVPQMAMRLIE